jgi:2-desacetyl-2-hydroxyethyl bacteriochlorophyllide A dehydrogenase
MKKTLSGQAVVASAPNRVALETVQIPAPGDEDVVVRVTHSWISNGTESSFVRGERIQGDTPRREDDPSPFPHVPGYQKCGIVEHAGAMVPDLKIGDAVFVSISQVEEMFYDHGGHVSPAVAHHSQAWKLPPHVPLLAASGLVLTQVGFNCGSRAPLDGGAAAVVIGDGLVGHWTAQTLRHRGARVALVGRHAERLQKFKMYYGDLRLVQADDTVSQLRDWAPEGVEVVVDTVGSIASLEAMMELVQPGKHLVSAGFYGTQGAIDIQQMRARELTLHAPAGWTRERMNATLNLLTSDALETESLITHRFPIQECSIAYDLILQRREPVLGVVFDW